MANGSRELANKSSEAIKDIHHIIAESLESVSEGQKTFIRGNKGIISIGGEKF